MVCVSDRGEVWEVWGYEPDLLASTSPPRQSVVLPTPVRTTEQYCSLLLTTSFSRFSMKSREVSAQGFGSVDKVSNLYPVMVISKESKQRTLWHMTDPRIA